MVKGLLELTLGGSVSHRGYAAGGHVLARLSKKQEKESLFLKYHTMVCNHCYLRSLAGFQPRYHQTV